MTSLRRAIGAGGWAMILTLGCSPANKQAAPLSAREQAIVNVGLAYRDASTALQHGPANEKELTPYLKKYGDPAQLLISPNDGEPYHITWGLTPSRPTKSAVGHRFLVYEKKGKDGKRYALDLMLKLHHLKAEDFASIPGSP